jgi:hypothetical protein
MKSCSAFWYERIVEWAQGFFVDNSEDVQSSTSVGFHSQG